MPLNGMTPANPPLPTDSYRPVQPVCGSQTSNLISESLVGLMLPATRQKGTGIGFDPAAARGGVNAPAASDCAIVIVVLGSLRLARPSQLIANTGLPANAAEASRNDVSPSGIRCLIMTNSPQDCFATVGLTNLQLLRPAANNPMQSSRCLKQSGILSATI